MESQVRFADPASNVRVFKLGEGMSVADLGAGSGHYTFAAARMVGESGTVYAIDVQRDLISALSADAKRQGFENVEVLWGDIDENGGVPLSDESVNAVILSNVLFQLGKKEIAMKEIARILRSKGKLLLIDWSDSFRGIGPQKDLVVDEKKARALCEFAGLRAVEHFTAGAYHYGLVCRKS